MITQTITIVNKLGLHARAASKLVNSASQYESEVYIDKQGYRVNAKSIMGVMMLAAGKGTEVVIEANGRDEAACMEALTLLINNRFHEPE